MRIYIAGVMSTKLYNELKKRKNVCLFRHRLESYYYVKTSIDKSKEQLEMYEGVNDENK